MRLAFGTVYYQTPLTQEALKNLSKSSFRYNGIDYWATGRDKVIVDTARQALHTHKAQKCAALNSEPDVDWVTVLKPEQVDLDYRTVIGKLVAKGKGQSPFSKQRNGCNSVTQRLVPGWQSGPENR